MKCTHGCASRNRLPQRVPLADLEASGEVYDCLHDLHGVLLKDLFRKFHKTLPLPDHNPFLIQNFYNANIGIINKFRKKSLVQFRRELFSAKIIYFIKKIFILEYIF